MVHQFLFETIFLFMYIKFFYLLQYNACVLNESKSVTTKFQYMLVTINRIIASLSIFHNFRIT